MPHTSQLPRASRETKTSCLLLTLLSLSLATLAGCAGDPTAPQDDGLVSARMSIQAEDVFAAAIGGGRRSAQDVSAQAFSFNDVLSIKVDVKEKVSGTVLLVNFDLNKNPATGWTGIIPALPRNKALIFTARAYKTILPSEANKLFSGSTEQTLDSDNLTVPFSLSPYTDGQTIVLPRILRIAVPSAFSSSQSNNISFVVEASTGENLTYALSAAGASGSGGTFYPAKGGLTLTGTAGTFVTQYLPPTVTSETVFEHKVTVTNAAGHSVTTTFKTTVKPPGKTDSVIGTEVAVFFNPVINALEASRADGTSDVVFTATVVDDSEEAVLKYAWSFTPNGTFDPAPAFTGTTKVGTLHDYAENVQGTVRVAVTDPKGGTTTLEYVLKPKQFLDKTTEVGKSDGLNSIRAGQDHTCALSNDGTVRCWGSGLLGQLGYGNTFLIGDSTTRPLTNATPVPFSGKAAKLAVGANHTCALMDTGYVVCWGKNTFGQLGYNSTDNVGDSEAISTLGFVNLGGTATKIAAGGNHTCALMDTGKVRCWGLNNVGQLGYGHVKNIGDDEQPWKEGDVKVGAPVTDIVAGENHTCALLNTGSVRCWGLSTSGQLGYGNTKTIGDDEAPETAGPVNLSSGNVIQLSAGGNHTCVLLDTGYVRCWGLNNYGQVGNTKSSCDSATGGCPRNENVGDNEVPGGDVATGGKVLQVAAGGLHTCALLESGTLKCWGIGNYGQIGYPGTSGAMLTTPSDKAVDVGGGTAFQITAGANHTCALMSTGTARCWGYGASGQLGYNNTKTIGDDELPGSSGDLKFAP